MDRANRRKRKHYRRRSWSPYALSARLLQDNKAHDSADDRLKDYEELSVIPTNNKRHRATKVEKTERRFREFMSWARERW